ncbi:alpha/beta hydrolase [Actinomadura macrotermitis]|uniref:Carboxylesterase A n=1 Tax=Actinomadura macrotermitis TaxID=2585200 RepID=A0A7K0BXU2_9ACTN|nr:Carboxylesterase A [Actinomadura macrotermitis]
MRTTRIAGAIVLTLALATACNDEPGVAKSPPQATDLQAYYAQRVTWKPCGDGFECGKAEVPLDYAKPGAEKIKLSLIRLPAGDKAHRIGSLLTNPGGPGGSGVEFIRNAGRTFGSDLRKRFDIVGFDPRGVGASAPVRCMDGPQLDRFFGADSSPDDQAEVDALAQVSKGFADACKARAAAELPRVGTRDAARDMDVLRGALGDKKLTYYGASYGTYLGTYYAEQFPGNIRAAVLDGAVDPTLSSTAILVEQAKGFETALRAFAADCVKTDCPLGKNVDGAIAKVSQLLAKADRTPLANRRDSRKINDSWAVMGIATAMYAKEYWPVLRQALSQALTRNDGTLLLAIADQMVERKPDGTYSNQTDANMAVNCVDKPNPPDTATYGKAADQAKRESPRFGAFVVWGGLPCVYWPVQTKEQPHAMAAKGSPPIVVIGTLRDPATPYKWARNLASQLDKGVLLSYDGDGHTAYLQGNACITKATDRYLIEGTPPKKGTLCH